MTIQCPRCGGTGTMCDGACSIGPEGSKTIKEPSRCAVCSGMRLVVTRPATEEEAKEAKEAREAMHKSLFLTHF